MCREYPIKWVFESFPLRIRKKELMIVVILFSLKTIKEI